MIVPAGLFVLAVFFWRLSRCTDDLVAGWFRFCFALFLLVLALVYVLALAAS